MDEMQFLDNWVKITKTFTRDSHWLTKVDHGGYIKYFLNPKIDRSYKGKDPDTGMPELFLEEEEFEAIQHKFDVLFECDWGSW